MDHHEHDQHEHDAPIETPTADDPDDNPSFVLGYN